MSAKVMEFRVREGESRRNLFAVKNDAFSAANMFDCGVQRFISRRVLRRWQRLRAHFGDRSHFARRLIVSRVPR